MEPQYPRLHDSGTEEPQDYSGPEREGLGRRLFIGFLIAAGAAMACWWGAPKIGIDAPWYVPVLAFAVIVAATVLPIVIAEAGKPHVDDADPGPDPSDQSP